LLPHAEALPARPFGGFGGWTLIVIVRDDVGIFERVHA